MAWRQLGIWLAKCIDLKTNFQVQNQLRQWLKPQLRQTAVGCRQNPRFLYSQSLFLTSFSTIFRLLICFFCDALIFFHDYNCILNACNPKFSAQIFNSVVSIITILIYNSQLSFFINGFHNLIFNQQLLAWLFGSTVSIILILISNFWLSFLVQRFQ